MRTSLLLLSGLLVAAAAFPNTQPQCTPGETRQVECNTCTCTSTGIFACTLIGCGRIPVCQHGPGYIDQCGNKCTCKDERGYSCSSHSCYEGNKAGEPMTCDKDGELRVRNNKRYFCHNGVMKFEETDQPNGCTAGARWPIQCGHCRCTAGGAMACVGGCTSHLGPDPLGSLVKMAGAAASKTYCDGACPADCGTQWDDSRQCLRCQCVPEPEFGDLVVALGQQCPAGLKRGVTFPAGVLCRGQGCIPGANWTVNDGCSRCVCTGDGEPACTPCQREPTESTVTCEDGLPSCPQDCGQSFNAEKNCYDCPCGVGQPGDTVVAIDEPCPPGTDFREAGAFLKACGPLDQLPQGDTKVCDSPDQRCPADCGLVRVSRAEGCVYCQCGAELAPGDEEIPIDEECRPPLLPGPYQLATKVCRAPTREECLPGNTYNIACDICICQEDGVPACTRRDCSLPKYLECPHGKAYVDECGNVCECGTGGYSCTEKACQNGQTTQPQACSGPGNLPKVTGKFVSCHEGIVKVQPPDEKCLPGAVFMDAEDCNSCFCAENGVAGCNLKACLTVPPAQPTDVYG